MADHNSSNSNPVLAFIVMMASSAGGLYGAIFFLGMLLGWTTGNIPIRGSLLNPWETGQFVGGLFNAGGNSSVQTFGDEKYFNNSKRIGDGASNPRLIVPARPANPNILPTSDRAQTSNLTEQNQSVTATYEDTNGDGIITPDEIAAQNKARSATKQ